MMNEFRLIPGSVVELAMPAAQLQMVTSYIRNIPFPFPLEMPTIQQESDEISSCVFPQVECIMGLAWEWEPSGVPLHNSSLCSLSILIEWKSVQTIIVQSSIELELKSRPLLVERENLQLEYMLDQQNHFCSSKLLEETTWNVFLGAWMNVMFSGKKSTHAPGGFNV